MIHIRGAVLERIGSPRPYAQSRPISVVDLDLDPPGDDEVLVRIEAAGVCHSDLSVVDGNRVRPVPMLLGHEAAGIAERVGDRVDDLAVGQRVVLVFLPRCGHCPSCGHRGHHPLRTGQRDQRRRNLARWRHPDQPFWATHLPPPRRLGFRDTCVVNRASAVAVPDEVPPQVAALLGCAVLTGGGAVLNVGKPVAGQSVAVVGLGGVGMAAVLTALTQDGVAVFGVDQLPQKLSAAEALGASATYTPQQAAAAGVKADVVIEAAGHPAALETAIGLTAPGGRTITVGLPPPDARISVAPLGFVAEGRSLIGSYLGSAVPSRDIPRFVSLWQSGRLPVESLVSATIRLDDLNEAMDHLADGTAVRQIIVF